jgi:hypothetical protein
MTENTSLSVTHGVRERVKKFADFKDETYSSILTTLMDITDEMKIFTDANVPKDVVGVISKLRYLNDENTIVVSTSEMSDEVVIEELNRSGRVWNHRRFAQIESEIATVQSALRQSLQQAIDQSSYTDKLKKFAEFEGETYSSILNRLIDVYQHTQLTPAQIDAKNPSEVFEAEHVIALALEVIRDNIPKGEQT